MTEHTPTPWRLCKYNGGDWFDVEPADGGGWFLRLSPGYPFIDFPDQAEVEANFNANAALIVLAVNSHAAMKAALEELIFQIAGDQHDAAEIDKAFGTKLLGAAITRARRALEEA